MGVQLKSVRRPVSMLSACLPCQHQMSCTVHFTNMEYFNSDGNYELLKCGASIIGTAGGPEWRAQFKPCNNTEQSLLNRYQMQKLISLEASLFSETNRLKDEDVKETSLCFYCFIVFHFEYSCRRSCKIS